MSPAERQGLDVARELLSPAGREILEVGCGRGAIARGLALAGGRVVAVDCGRCVLREAHGTNVPSSLQFVAGRAEALPLREASRDVVLFFNSLHHVTAGDQTRCLAESARVLRPQGHLFIAEPLAEGPHFELGLPIDDESAVRAAALSNIRRADSLGLGLLREISYTQRARYASFEAFRLAKLAADPARLDRFEAARAELKRRYERLGERCNGGRAFAQPMRVHLLQKRD